MESKIPELHDRIIVATCLQESVEALITNDPEIIKSNEIKTIW
jgi:predicted nucleic acid-binding protein